MLIVTFLIKLVIFKEKTRFFSVLDTCYQWQTEKHTFFEKMKITSV